MQRLAVAHLIGLNAPSKSSLLTCTVSPFHLKLEAFWAAVRTPRGDQLNLYARGLLAASGAGSPPHTEVNDVIFPPETSHQSTNQPTNQQSTTTTTFVTDRQHRTRSGTNRGTLSLHIIDHHFG